MDKQLKRLESELTRYILSHGAKDEQVLGMVQRGGSSKLGTVVKILCLHLLTFLISFLVLFYLRQYQIFRILFFVLLVIDALIHVYSMITSLRDAIIFGDSTVSYFFVTTHALYECNGFHCGCIYFWSFDELVMLEYGEGKVILTAKHFLSDAPLHSNDKREEELAKLNRRHLLMKEPIERRNYSFSDLLTRPAESLPVGGYNRVTRHTHRHKIAPSLQTRTLRFSSGSEMPEICRDAASGYRHIKIKKIGYDMKSVE